MTIDLGGNEMREEDACKGAGRISSPWMHPCMHMYSLTHMHE